MRLISFQSDSGPRIGAIDSTVDNSACVVLSDADPSLPTEMSQLLSLGDEVWPRIAAAYEQGSPRDVNGLRLIAPVPAPQKILCVGANYADHAAESGMAIPEEPIIFSKFPTTLCGPGDTIRLPKVGADVDFEAELVVVIGKAGKNIPHDQAYDHVAGYCCGHDVSARDWQKGKPGKQWTLGKGFDTFAPLGPYLVSPDETGDVNDLRVRLRLNGETMQDSSTSQFIFKVDELIAYISQVCTLLPGDLLYTGTPPGVGMARTPPVFLQDEDVVEVEIENLGVLSNTVANE